ncbi:RNAse R [Tahibacter aquaticus]|uniref:Ribonuclease R n=1 Tax=Tahibacter aquaticus TaxID=520092 RepID=A0A4V3DME1_9GAMM|nr:ribonuclease R [Tahibacter aquaticus]TDR44120.1 RNAse R [Tahibacter aquaticus]
MKKTRSTDTTRSGNKKAARPGWMPETAPPSRGKRSTEVAATTGGAAPKPRAVRKMAAMAAPVAAPTAAAPKPGAARKTMAKTGKSTPPAMPPPEAAARRPRNSAVTAEAAGSDPFAEREQQRYEHPIPSREAILSFLAEQGQLMNAEAVAKALSLTHERDFGALTKRLAAMLRDGQLIQNRRGGYGVAQKLDLVAGVILANPDGYGFLKPDAGGEDLYLSPFEMRKVLHGDRVLGSVVGVDRRGRRQGAIVEVLERRSPRLVGRIIEQDGLMLVAPDDRRLHQDILIAPGKECGARSGQIVVAEITEPPGQHRGPIGRVVAVLGERLTPSLTVEMAIASHDIPHEWPEPVLREAAQVEPEVKDFSGRKDLRGLPLVTIDGEDARDFDDAVFAEPSAGGFRLVVAIADVSHYVQPETALDEEAYKRATSVYFPGFVVPMLPETLSNGICSLNPKVERLCMVCDMLVDQEGEVIKSKFYPAVMRSHARLTYNQVWLALGEKNADARAQIGTLMPHIEQLYKLYKVLAKARKRRGAIDFESTEVKFRLAPSGEVVQLGAEPRNDAHKLIEECMIAANVQAARFLDKAHVPALYRVHEPPPEGKYHDLLEFLKDFSLKMPTAADVEPADFATLIRKIQNRPDASLIQSVLLRSQSLAAYQPDCGGHFGLALDAYAHFTSPIRRYPDLLVHRALRYAIAKGKPASYRYSPTAMASMAVHCSQCGRRAEEAERDVDERYKCAWMEKHVGSEFDGIVSGVTSFGLFVELVDSKVTGLVHITQLPNDYYHFDPIRHLLTGERRGLKFRLGDAVRIQVLRASLEDRKIDFRLVANETPVEKKRR